MVEDPMVNLSISNHAGLIAGCLKKNATDKNNTIFPA
jgi:hypothetical protein